MDFWMNNIVYRDNVGDVVLAAKEYIRNLCHLVNLRIAGGSDEGKMGRLMSQLSSFISSEQQASANTPQ